MNSQDQSRAQRSDPGPSDRSAQRTERRNPRSMDLHRLSVARCVDLFVAEDRVICDAMARSSRALCALIEAIEPGFCAGGRLIYVGAGTSGRLGVLDAAEAPPTFQTDAGRVVGIIAGGDSALRRSSEGLEDDPRGAWPELDALDPGSDDAVIGIAAGGTTPYVLGAIARCGDYPDPPTTGLIVCSPPSGSVKVDHLVLIDTGPEVLTGSTRLKAATATKLALNTISTTLMVRSGRVYQNLMVDLRATNDKLRDRAARIVMELSGLDRAGALDLLDRAGGSVKTAIVMARLGLDRAGAEHRLGESDGRLDRLLGDDAGA